MARRTRIAKDASSDEKDTAEARLDDIRVREVSTVPRAANGRRFLVVKDAKGAEVPVELVSDGKGGLKQVPIEKETATAEPQPGSMAQTGDAPVATGNLKGAGEALGAASNDAHSAAEAEEANKSADDPEEYDDYDSCVSGLTDSGMEDGEAASACSAVHKAAWTGAGVNDLPDSAFLHVEGGGKKDEGGKTVPRSLRHFPYRNSGGSIDLPHLRNALSRIPQSSLPADVKTRLSAKAERLLSGKKGETAKTNVPQPGVGSVAEKTATAEKPNVGSVAEKAQTAAAVKPGSVEDTTDGKPGATDIVSKEGRILAGHRLAKLREIADQHTAIGKALVGCIKEMEPMVAQMDASPIGKSIQDPVPTVVGANAGLKTDGAEIKGVTPPQAAPPDSVSEIPNLVAKLNSQVEKLSAEVAKANAEKDALAKAVQEQGEIQEKILSHRGAGNAVPIDKDATPRAAEPEHNWPSVIKPRPRNRTSA
jgi:hypothetical protein